MLGAPGPAGTSIGVRDVLIPVIEATRATRRIAATRGPARLPIPGADGRARLTSERQQGPSPQARDDFVR